MSLAEKVFEEGRQEGRQKAILEVLGERFGAAPPKVVKRVHSLTRDIQISHAVRLAVSCESYQDFLKDLS